MTYLPAASPVPQVKTWPLGADFTVERGLETITALVKVSQVATCSTCPIVTLWLFAVSAGVSVRAGNTAPTFLQKRVSCSHTE